MTKKRKSQSICRVMLQKFRSSSKALPYLQVYTLVWVIAINVNCTSNMLLNHVLMQCSAAHVKLMGEQQNEITENDKNEKITVIWLAAKVTLAILMWFQFKWIDNYHCFLNGLHYKSLLFVRSPHSCWKIQHYYTGEMPWGLWRSGQLTMQHTHGQSQHSVRLCILPGKPVWDALKQPERWFWR